MFRPLLLILFIKSMYSLIGWLLFFPLRTWRLKNMRVYITSHLLPAKSNSIRIIIWFCWSPSQAKEILTPANHKNDHKDNIFPYFNFTYLDIKNTLKFMALRLKVYSFKINRVLTKSLEMQWTSKIWPEPQVHLCSVELYFDVSS